MSVFEMAKKYYPKLWKKARLDSLLAAGHLSAEEYDKLIKETPHEDNLSQDPR